MSLWENQKGPRPEGQHWPAQPHSSSCSAWSPGARCHSPPFIGWPPTTPLDLFALQCFTEELVFLFLVERDAEMLTFNSQEKRQLKTSVWFLLSPYAAMYRQPEGNQSQNQSEWLRLERASGGHLVHSPLGVKLRCFVFTDVQASPFPSLHAMCYLPALWPVLADHIKLNHWAHHKKVFQENFWSLFKFLLDLSLGVHVQINWIDPLIQYFMLEGKWIRSLNFQKWKRFPNSLYQAGHRAGFLYTHTHTLHSLISLHHRYSPHSLNAVGMQNIQRCIRKKLDTNLQTGNKKENGKKIKASAVHRYIP